MTAVSMRGKVTLRGVSVIACLLWVSAGAARAQDDASSAGGLQFAGELQEVTSGSISVRLADGRIIHARNTATEGDLSSRALAERYSVGDQVRIDCAKIPEVYDPALRRPHSLALKELKFLRHPNPAESAKARASMAWRQPHNLLHPAAVAPPVPVGRLLDTIALPDTHEKPATEAAANRSSRLDLIRSRVREFVETMPNFVADEMAKRYISDTNPPKWRQVDTLECEITFRGSDELREHIKLSGKPWNQPYEALPGTKWEGGFGAELPALFNQDCSTTFELEGRVQEGGKSLSVVRYSSPPDGCVGIFTEGYQSFFAAQTGRILLDEREQNVIRVEANSSRFPKAFPMSGAESRISWDYVKVGDEMHLLPVAADFILVRSDGGMNLIRQEYKNHRHFQASSKIKFE